MLIDVLTLIAPDPKVLGQNYLKGSTPSITYLSDPDANGLRQLVYMKGLQGYPWDWLTVGNDFIYQRLTENVWSDPSTGKVQHGLGSPRFPRWIDYSYPAVSFTSTPSAASAPSQVPGLVASLISTPVLLVAPAVPVPTPGQWQFLVDRPHTDYVIYGPGAKPTSANTDAGVRNTLRGPYPGAAINDLPAGEDWIADYEWGGKLVNGVMQYGTTERIWHRKGYGRYQWASFAWRADGDYSTVKPNQSSQTSSIVPLASPVTPKELIFGNTFVS